MAARWLIAVVGPTAVGKTNVAVKLAQRFSTAVVNADSRQVFREMKIGTASPDDSAMSGVPHFLVGHLSVVQSYNASMYEADALKILSSLFENHNRVILTGGSGFYVQAVCKGIDNLPSIDPKVRKRLKTELSDKGMDWLREEVKQKDPLYFGQVDRNNPNRMLKALEVYEMAGMPYSGFLTRQVKIRDFSCLYIGLDLPREALHSQINHRTEQMMRNGLLNEVKSLQLYRNLNALNTVGYKELFRHLDGSLTLADALDQIKAHTRQYARRQLTWFKRIGDIRWFHPANIEDIVAYICEKTAEHG